MRGPELERLYDGHAQPLFAFLLNFTRDEADTRDLLQDIFIKLAREPDLLAGVRDERAFLLRLAHNAAIDLIRRRGTRERTRENFAPKEFLFLPRPKIQMRKRFAPNCPGRWPNCRRSSGSWCI